MNDLRRKFHWYYVFLFVILIHLFIRFLLIFSYSVDLDGTEFAFLHNAQLISKGISIYRDPDAFPFYAVMYTPLYPYLLAFIAKLLSVNPVYEVHRLMVIARSINWMLMFADLALLYKIMIRFRLSKNYIFLLLMYFVLLVTGHCYTTRPDGMKITLYILQLYAIIRYFYSGEEQKKYLLLIVICNVVSFLLKQDSIIYANLILLILILSKKNKESVLLFSACALLIAFSYAGCVLFFSKSFYTNTFIYNFQSITDFKNSYNIIVIYGSIIRLSLLLALCMYGIWKSRKNITADSPEFLLGAALIPLFVASHIFMLKSGAYLNYSFELIVVLVLLSAMLLSRFLPHPKAGKLLTAACTLYFVLLILANKTLNNYTYDSNVQKALKAQYSERFQTSHEIKQIIQNDTFFLPDASNLVYFGSFKNIFYGYDAHVDRFINLYLHLDVKSSLLIASPAKVDESYLNGSLKYIVIANDARSAAHMKKYYPRYSVFRRVREFNIYKFNSILE